MLHFSHGGVIKSFLLQPPGNVKSSRIFLFYSVEDLDFEIHAIHDSREVQYYANEQMLLDTTHLFKLHFICRLFIMSTLRYADGVRFLKYFYFETWVY